MLGRVGAVVDRGVRLMRNAYIDFRITGRFLGGRMRTNFPHLGVTAVANTNYAYLPALLDGRIGAEDVFVDVGCGKGRVLCWLLYRKFANKLYGIELEPEVAAKTRAYLSRYENVHIITGNVMENIPRDATLFYLYNPFDETRALQFKKALEDTFLPLKKSIRVIYYYSHNIHLFEKDPRWTSQAISVQNHEAALLTLKAAE